MRSANPSEGRLASPSRNTPSAGLKRCVGRSPGLRSRILSFDPRLPDPVWGSGFGGSLRSRSRGRLLFEPKPSDLSLWHSLFACHRTRTNAGAPFADARNLSSRRTTSDMSEQDATANEDVASKTAVDTRHAEKMAKIKVARDKIMATKSGEKGLIIVHTGAGKGKSSSAFGMIVRCVAHGFPCAVVQFIKGAWDTGERRLLTGHFSDLC